MWRSGSQSSDHCTPDNLDPSSQWNQIESPFSRQHPIPPSILPERSRTDIVSSAPLISHAYPFGSHVIGTVGAFSRSNGEATLRNPSLNPPCTYGAFGLPRTNHGSVQGTGGFIKSPQTDMCIAPFPTIWFANWDS